MQRRRDVRLRRLPLTAVPQLDPAQVSRQGAEVVVALGLALAFLLLGCGPRAEPGLEPPSPVDVGKRADGGTRTPTTPASGGNGAMPPGTGAAGSTMTPVPHQDAGATRPGDEAMDEDAGSADGGTGPTILVPPPEPLNCITDVSAGLHTFECDGITHDLKVPDACLQTQCGLVIDVHGGTMSSRMENNNTDMQRIGSEHGYVVLQPSAADNLWDASTDDAKVFAFAKDVISAFHLDEKRIHMMGFSQGGYMSWRFMCQHGDWLASVAPAAAAGEANISPEVGCTFTGSDVPQHGEIPVLYMHGHKDGMVAFDNAIVLTDAVRKVFETGDGEVVAMGDGFTRTRYTNPRGNVFEFIEHDYASPSEVGIPPLLGVAIMGHCYPGSTDFMPTEPDQLMAFGCTPPTAFHWGEEVMRFFIAHPKG